MDSPLFTITFTLKNGYTDQRYYINRIFTVHNKTGECELLTPFSSDMNQRDVITTKHKSNIIDKLLGATVILTKYVAGYPGDMEISYITPDGAKYDMLMAEETSTPTGYTRLFY
jgi:hypothetical protein